MLSPRELHSPRSPIRFNVNIKDCHSYGAPKRWCSKTCNKGRVESCQEKTFPFGEKLLQFLNRGLNLDPPPPLLPKQVGLHQVKNHKAAQSTWAFEETICLKMQTGGNLIVATHSQWQPLILEESLAGKAQINLSAGWTFETNCRFHNQVNCCDFWSTTATCGKEEKTVKTPHFRELPSFTSNSHRIGDSHMHKARPCWGVRPNMGTLLPGLNC